MIEDNNVTQNIVETNTKKVFINHKGGFRDGGHKETLLLPIKWRYASIYCFKLTSILFMHFPYLLPIIFSFL